MNNYQLRNSLKKEKGKKNKKERKIKINSHLLLLYLNRNLKFILLIDCRHLTIKVISHIFNLLQTDLSYMEMDLLKFVKFNL